MRDGAPHDADPARPPRGRLGRAFLYALSPLLIVALLLTYRLAPAFYLEHVLEFHAREGQIVEVATLLFALGASVLLGWSALRLWRLRRMAKVTGGAVITAVVAAAAFFFAGEELSWGQDLFKWETPEMLLPHTRATNLHNVDTLPIRVKPLAGLFIISVFFALPGLWRLGRPRLPRDWAPAIAEGPVIFCILVAFAWRWSKSAYQWANPGFDSDREAYPWYWEFFEQVPEHKEMLVALGLLLYGVYRVGTARRITRDGARSPATRPPS